jgi:hypothetical protein
MLWDPAASRVVGISGSGRSPRSLSLETVRARTRKACSPHMARHGDGARDRRRLVAPPPALRQTALGRIVRAGDCLC